jgi:hypothetical protein
MLRWLPLLLLTGCTTSPPEPLWFGHVGFATEESLQPLRERLKADDAAHVRVRHAEPGENPRAVAVRLLAVHGVKGLILGPGLSKPAEVVAAVRPYGVPVVVLDDSEPIEGAMILGSGLDQRLRVLLEALTPEERLGPVRLLSAPPRAEPRVRAAGLRIDPKASATLDPEKGIYHDGTRQIAILNQSATLTEAVNLLLRGETTEPPLPKLTVQRSDGR